MSLTSCGHSNKAFVYLSKDRCLQSKQSEPDKILPYVSLYLDLHCLSYDPIGGFQS